MTPRPDIGQGGRERPTIVSMMLEAAAFLRSFAEPDPTDIPGPRGDGHAVLFLPATGRGDAQTVRVRAFLAVRGYTPFGWGLGVNFGPAPRLMTGAMDRLVELAADRGPVSVVGYSMGGLFARWLALRAPRLVRQTVTVCAPFRNALRSTWFPLETMGALWPGADLRALAAEVEKPLSVPNTAIYSRTDGIVDWRCCFDPAASGDNFEVTGPHTTMAGNAEVRRILLERLARRL